MMGSKKTAIVLQPFGLGDCIFSQGIAYDLISKGYDINWPVKPAFVDGLKEAYPHINWLPDFLFKPELFNIKQDKEIDGVRIIPIRWADSIIKVPIKQWMRAKYDMYGIDWREWKQYASYQRVLSREYELCELLGVDITKPFNLVNSTYRSDFAAKLNIKIDNNHPTYTIEQRPGYSLFDYSLLIEQATEIHVANSSILYLLELLNFTGTAHIYARPEEGGGFPFVDYIMTKPYVLHG